MIECHHRESQQQTAQRFFQGKTGAAFIASTEPTPFICQIKAKRFDILPTCELPEESHLTCPIALWKSGEITFQEANQRLRTLFDAPPQPK